LFSSRTGQDDKFRQAEWFVFFEVDASDRGESWYVRAQARQETGEPRMISLNN